MEYLRSLVSTKTRRGRAIRTALQGMVALLSFMLGLLTIPGFGDYLSNVGFEAQVASFGVWIGIISYLQNATEAVIKHLWEE